MNWPTIIGALVVLAIFAAVIITGVRNRKKHKGGCSCGGCGGCPSSGICHPDKK